MVFEVMESGLHTTVQDLGRYGYQQYGISPAGAMDDVSYQLGNILLGNPRNAASLEITMVGPTLKALKDTIISITGANLSPSLDGKTVDMWRNILVEKGQTLRFGKPVAGARAYLAVIGGIHVPEVMGSKSTYVKGNFGGMNGRPLAERDIVEASNVPTDYKSMTRKKLSKDAQPSFLGKIRVVQGPQWDHFTEGAIHDFLNSPFTITNQSDRMGYRLQGNMGIALRDQGRKEMITDPVAKGSIQVPKNGSPIILMSDRQTTGGYPKIANVISAELYKVAQRLPGEQIVFEKVSVVEAQRQWRNREKLFRQLELGVALR
ncbi:MULTISPECIES: biotin-dependent carboxyltransferase family protein [Bacillaceae]|nr:MULTISPECIES: biotin-dependent carboxyltransferase family protein [Bacillaceae]